MTTTPPPIQRITFALFFLMALLMLGLVLWPFWNQLFLAFFLATIFHPAYSRLSSKTRPWVAAALTCTLITLCVFLPLVYCVISISAEIPAVIQLGRKNDIFLILQQTLQNNTLISRAGTFLADFGINFEVAGIPDLITRLLTSTGLFVSRQVSAWAADVMRFFLQFCILIVCIYFLLIEYHKLTGFLHKLSPLPESQNKLLIDKFSSIAGTILVGNGLSGIIQGVLGGLFFTAMGLVSPVLWGVVMGTLAFLPILGVGLVLLPTALILFLKGKIWQAIVTLCFYLFLTVFIEYMFKPKFVGAQAQLPPLLVLLSIIGGMSLSGVMGIIYGPVAVTAFLTLTDMYVLEYQPYFDKRDGNVD
jgi:predicted PurR-regulated permease PerM